MSMEQAKAFLERMKNDDRFMEGVIGIEDVETRMEYIRREGFDVTDGEIFHALEDAKKNDLTESRQPSGVQGILADRPSQPSAALCRIDLLAKVLLQP